MSSDTHNTFPDRSKDRLKAIAEKLRVKRDTYIEEAEQNIDRHAATVSLVLAEVVLAISETLLNEVYNRTQDDEPEPVRPAPGQWKCGCGYPMPDGCCYCPECQP